MVSRIEGEFKNDGLFGRVTDKLLMVSEGM